MGFPGESDEDFADTLAVCERLGFGHIHTFPYSRRDGTRAVGMDGHISEAVKKSRAESVRKLSVITKRAYRSSLLGTVPEVLVEKADKQSDGSIRARGLSAGYVPVKFSISGEGGAGKYTVESVLNRIFRVEIDGLEPGDDPDLFGVSI